MLSACTGSGFPAEWTTATAGVTYWFVTEAIKRQFTSSYTITDYQTSDGSAYGKYHLDKLFVSLAFHG